MPIPNIFYIVTCLRGVDGDEQETVLATRRAWRDRTQALVYASSIHESRNPQVVECTFGVNFEIVEA